MIFQTAFAGKAHATERQRVDTVLPTGFDCLTSAVIPAQAGIQTLVFRAYFKAAANSNLWIFAYFPCVGGNGNNGNGEQGGRLR